MIFAKGESNAIGQIDVKPAGILHVAAPSTTPHGPCDSDTSDRLKCACGSSELVNGIDPGINGQPQVPDRSVPKSALVAHNQAVAATAQESSRKPNIIVLWGDDIGVHKIIANNHGIMGYKTPKIDRIAKEGQFFIDSYA